MGGVNFNGLDTVVHGPIRLGVLTALHANAGMDFTTLKSRLSVPDGTLGQHLEKLEATGYIACTKSFVGQRPRSTYRLTPDGQKALGQYLDAMQAIIDSARSGRG